MKRIITAVLCLLFTLVADAFCDGFSSGFTPYRPFKPVSQQQDDVIDKIPEAAKEKLRKQRIDQGLSGQENPRATQEGQITAIHQFPDLAVLNSPLNKLFTSEFARLKSADPNFFNNPNWPLILAQSCAEQLNHVNSQITHKANAPAKTASTAGTTNPVDPAGSPATAAQPQGAVATLAQNDATFGSGLGASLPGASLGEQTAPVIGEGGMATAPAQLEQEAEHTKRMQEEKLAQQELARQHAEAEKQRAEAEAHEAEIKAKLQAEHDRLKLYGKIALGGISVAAFFYGLWRQMKKDLHGKAYHWKSLEGLLVCVLGYGWMLFIFLPNANIEKHYSYSIYILASSALSAATLSMLNFLRPKPIPIIQGVAALFFTMTAGLFILLTFQSIAHWTLQHHLILRGKAFVLLYPLVKFIGWSYQAIYSSSFSDRLIGFIFGVGLCEELTKLLPLFYLVLINKAVSLKSRISYVSFVFIGFLSGVGFGIGEALMCYSPWSGTLSLSANVLRWFALVPSHGIWSATAAACLWYISPRIERQNGLIKITSLCISAAIVVAVLHGVYDVLCDIQIVGPILATASIVAFYAVIRLIDRATNHLAGHSNDESVGESNKISVRFFDQISNTRLTRAVHVVCFISILTVAAALSASIDAALSNSYSAKPQYDTEQESDLYKQGYNMGVDDRMVEEWSDTDLSAILSASGIVLNMKDFKLFTKGYHNGRHSFGGKLRF